MRALLRRASWVVAIGLIAAWVSIAIADGGGDGVVGGAPVPEGAWPDSVAVLGDGGRCTGTLIAPDVVLTAGHCIGIEPTTVVVGAVALDGSTGEWIRVTEAHAYPAWEDRFDVGVLVLEHGSRTAPRAVARTCTVRETLRRGAEVTVVGFGRTTPDGGAEERVTKNAATIPVTDPVCTTDPSCQDAIDPGGEFIAGGRGADACFGDSGGPAYVDTGAGPVVLGVVSRGLAGDWQCGNGGVYVRADRVVRWIEETTGRSIARATCDGGADDPGGGGDEPGGCAATGTGAAGAGAAGALAIALGLARAVRRRRDRLRWHRIDEEPRCR